jgi:hypothetical protein
MSDRTGRGLAWALWGVIVLAYLVEVVLLFATADMATTDPVDQAGPWLQALGDLAFVVAGSLGLRIVLEHPGNAAGWWIMAAGLIPLERVAVEFTQYGLERWGAVPVVVFAGWVTQWIWVLGTYNIPFLLLLYPDGHLPSRRWRPVLWLAVTLLALTFVTSSIYVDPEARLPNPVGVPGLSPTIESLSFPIFAVGEYLLLLLGVLSLVARYRRGEGVERQQVKVLIWVGAVAVVFFVVVGNLDLPGWMSPIFNLTFTTFVAASITLAILRYRLYDLDRLVSRTVSYALVAGLLAAVYAFGAVWLPSHVVGGQTPLFVAGSTLAVAALFNPLRRRVMTWVDRRFNRSRYDLEQTVEEFARKLRDQTDTDRLAGDWAEVVAGTLEPAALGVWVRDQSVR